MKILLVEDTDLVLKYETQILRGAGHTVRATHDGDSAAKYYDDHRYDLVLTDLWHPGLEGHNLIKRIFKKNAHQIVGVISKTTLMEEKLDVPLLQKPFKPSELLAFVSKITGTPEQRKKALALVSKGTDYDLSIFARSTKIRFPTSGW